MMDPTPFFVGGGAEHSPEVVRQFIYDSTGGAEGVSGPGALKVLPMAAATSRVRVQPGGFLLNNRYPGGSGQSYDGRNATETEVEVPNTGSGGGRVDMLVARVLDPQYEGQPPADPNNFDYSRLQLIQGVSPTVETAAELNLNYPAVELARITQPLNNTAVTAAMVKDLRKLARPQSVRRQIVIQPKADHNIPTSYSSWPITAGERPQVFVPRWATHLTLKADYGGIEFIGTTRTVAGIRTGFGAEASENGIIIAETAGRGHYVVGAEHVVPDTLKGKFALINLQAMRSDGTGNLQADYQSTIILNYEFTERAV